MIKKISIFIIALTACSCFLAALPVQAEQLSQSYMQISGVGNVTVQQLIGNLIKTLMGIVGSIALLMIIVGGIQWMTARGVADQVKKARDTVLWAALGLVAIFLSYAVVEFILRAFSAI